MNPEWRSRYNLGVEAARKGGDFARQMYDSTFSDRNMEVIRKADNSPVTVAHRGAEEIIRKERVGIVVDQAANDGYDRAAEELLRLLADPTLAHRCRSAAEMSLTELASVNGAISAPA